MNIGLAGEFKWEKRKVDTNLLVDFSDWEDNLILDQAFTEIAVNGFNGQGYIDLGTGSTPPQVSDTALVARRNDGVRMSPSSHSYYNFPDKKKIVCTSLFTGTYRPNTSVNLAELGLRPNGGKLHTRALFKKNGSPTTVTVLPDEYLTVYYRIWVVYDSSVITVSIHSKKTSRGQSLSDNTISVKSRFITRLQKEENLQNTQYYLGVIQRNKGTIYSSNTLICTDKVDVDNLAYFGTHSGTYFYENHRNKYKSGNSNSFKITQKSSEYVSGVLTLTDRYTLDTNFATNIDDPIKTVLIDTEFCWIILSSDSLAESKKDTQKLYIDIEYKFQRYSGTLEEIKRGTPYEV